MLVRRGRLELAPDTRTGIREACAIPNLRVFPVTESIAIEAGLLEDFHGDPADRIIVSTALELHAALATRDHRIRRSKRIETIW